MVILIENSFCWRLTIGWLLLVCTSLAAPSVAKPPHVILITIDTLRADHLGCYGYKQIQTPNIDALAAQGVRFTNAHAVVPVTLPSHTTIMTGTYPMYNGMHDFSGNKLNPQQPTLASVLHEHGYATGAVVAAAVLDSRFGLNHGFDFYYDRFDVRPLMEQDLDETERPGNEVMDLALDWLRKNQRRPFFIWIHLYDPHYPYRPPAPYDAQYKDHLYDGEIAFADAQVGRLVDYLRAAKLYANSLIALTGDHGESLGEHGEKTHGFFIYNSTLHVPLIMKLPGTGTVHKQIISDPVSLVDLMPTLLGVLHIAPPSATQGHSLLRLLEGRVASKEATSDIYGETFLPRLHFDWSELRGIEIGDYHYINAPKPELYDVVHDPGETHNLFADKRALAAEYDGKLAQTIREYSSDRASAEKTGLDPELLERLKSLGYAAVSPGKPSDAKSGTLPDPKDRIQVYELVSQAIEDSQHGRFAPSVQGLKAALATEKDSVPIHYLLGLNYYRMEDFASAVPEFEFVVKQSPDYTLALGNLGAAYGHLGENAKAVTYLKRALEFDPTNFTDAFNLGAAYAGQQMLPEAVAAFQQSVTINPGYAAGHRALGQIFLSTGQNSEAVQQLRLLTQLQPNNPNAHLLLAKALEASGLQAEATHEAQKAQQLASGPNK